ncbi:MAG: hypothetical protein HY869_05400 [Chloroflexi bacterium]|nr:hypothetical protein [Chloroflexota bacterium]
MSSKKPSSPPAGYEAHYDRELKGTIKRHGADDLYNEIELIRYLNLLLLKRMKVEGKKLTYHDHLETLRAFTHSAGKIAHLVEIQYRVFEPLNKMEAAHEQEMDVVNQRILEIASLFLGEEKAGKVEFEALMQIMSNQNRNNK